MKCTINILLFLILSFCGKSQNIDSLIQISTSTKNDSIKCGALTRISFELVEDKTQEALLYGFKAKEIAEKINSKYHKQRVYEVIGQCYSFLKNFQQSYTYFQKAIFINSQTKDEQFFGVICNNLALSFYFQAKLDSSLYYHFKSLDVRIKRNDKKGIAANYNNIGLLYKLKKDYNTSITYYNLSLSIKREIGDKKGEFSTLNNVGSLYKQLKNYDSAFVVFKRLTEIAEQKNAFSVYAASKNNMALCLNSMRRYEEALQLMESLYADKKIKDQKDVYSLLLFGLGEANAGLKKYKSAFEYLQQALTMNVSVGQIEFSAEIHRLLAEMAEKNNNPSIALIHYKKYWELLDSLQKNMNVLGVNELTAKYEAVQKEQRIALLNKENQLKDAKLNEKEKNLLLLQAKEQQRQQELALLNKENQLQELSLKEDQQKLLLEKTENEKAKQQMVLLNKDNELKAISIKENKTTNWLYATLLCLLTIVASSIFILYRNKQKAELLLQEQNTIIQKSLEEKEILLKEIHHRVKNNLQVVSSLLNLQSRSISDAKALAAIKEGRDRVKSMALIHQNLYSDNNLTGVDMKDYIEKLIHALFASYNIQEGRVRLQTDVDDLNLDVDTVVPIGLIITELISNALKYAFSDVEQNGELLIKLKQQNGNLFLQVKDNGKGLPQGWSYENTTSLGYQLIRSFASKMKSTLTITSNNGTDVQMLITKYKTTV
jgi:two-component sensor histidine kinase